MLNMCILVGIFKELIQKYNKVILILRIPSSEKNKDGIYEADLIKCIVPKEKVKYINEYCAINSIIGVKGQLRVIDNEMVVVINKATFLSSKENTKKLNKTNY